LINNPKKGYSLEKTPDNFWRESLIEGGTPGFENSKYIPPKPEPTPDPEDDSKEKNCSGDIYLNKIFPFKEEYVELVNKGSEKCNMKGWSIVDAMGYDPEDEKLKEKDWSYHRNQFSADQTIDSGGYAYFRGNLYLNDDEDSVKLFNADKIKVQSVLYENAEKHKGFSYVLNNNKWKWDEIVIEASHPKVKIVAVNANPKGSDADFETLTIANRSKKKINLDGWSIATGWKKPSNHPIRGDFVIKAGKEREITREFSRFTLNNEKTKIELRYPDGEVAYAMKYKKKKDSIAEGEIYQKGKKGWKWVAAESLAQPSSPETEIIVAGADKPSVINNAENNEANKVVEVSIADIPNQPVRKNKIVLLSARPIAKIGMLDSQPRVLGAETVREAGGVYHFTPQFSAPEHYAIVFLKSLFSGINQKTNLLINYFLN